MKLVVSCRLGETNITSNGLDAECRSGLGLVYVCNVPAFGYCSLSVISELDWDLMMMSLSKVSRISPRLRL
jgi:hypothetical protein